jgi:hypothetical protein
MRPILYMCGAPEHLSAFAVRCYHNNIESESTAVKIVQLTCVVYHIAEPFCILGQMEKDLSISISMKQEDPSYVIDELPAGKLPPECLLTIDIS